MIAAPAMRHAKGFINSQNIFLQMPFSFSPSSLSLLKDCPRCFWLKFNEKIKRPEGIFPSLPSGMDLVLKKHFDSFMERQKLPPELAELEGHAALFDDFVLLEKWRDFRKGLRWKDEEGNVLRGAIDNILSFGEKLAVLDYKTRGFPLEEDSQEYYLDQLCFYNFLLQKNGFKTEDFSFLLFYYPDKVRENGDIVFHSKLVKVKTDAGNAEKIFKKALETVNARIPAEKCDWCRNI